MLADGESFVPQICMWGVTEVQRAAEIDGSLVRTGEHVNYTVVAAKCVCGTANSAGWSHVVGDAEWFPHTRTEASADLNEVGIRLFVALELDGDERPRSDPMCGGSRNRRGWRV